MMLAKLYKFLCDWHFEIPYTALNNNEKCSIQAEPESESSTMSLPSPFREIRMLKEPKDGKLVSLGLISVGMALTGLAVLVDPNTDEGQKTSSGAENASDTPLEAAKDC